MISDGMNDSTTHQSHVTSGDHDTPAADSGLRVYVGSHCTNCEQSRRLARSVKRQIPAIHVDVWDIDRRSPVDDIIAVPTFYYRGRQISLGNPTIAELCARVVRIESEAFGRTLLVQEERQRFAGFLGFVHRVCSDAWRAVASCSRRMREVVRFCCRQIVAISSR